MSVDVAMKFKPIAKKIAHRVIGDFFTAPSQKNTNLANTVLADTEIILHLEME